MVLRQTLRRLTCVSGGVIEELAGGQMAPGHDTNLAGISTWGLCLPPTRSPGMVSEQQP
jgi:hypothetical protein